MSKEHLDIIERLKLATETKSDAALGRAIGVKQGSIGTARSREEVPPRWIVYVSMKYGVSADWILYGDDSEKKSTVPGKTSSSPEVDLSLIPKVLARLSAGGGSLETSDKIEGRYAFRTDWIRMKGDPSKMILMDVSGESMAPEIKDGDTVLIDQEQSDIYVGKIYAVSIDQEIVVKYVEKSPGKLILRSANRGWENIEVDIRGDLGESVHIIGRVVWVARELA